MVPSQLLSKAAQVAMRLIPEQLSTTLDNHQCPVEENQDPSSGSSNDASINSPRKCNSSITPAFNMRNPNESSAASLKELEHPQPVKGFVRDRSSPCCPETSCSVERLSLNFGRPSKYRSLRRLQPQRWQSRQD